MVNKFDYRWLNGISQGTTVHRLTIIVSYSDYKFNTTDIVFLIPDSEAIRAIVATRAFMFVKQSNLTPLRIPGDMILLNEAIEIN